MPHVGIEGFTPGDHQDDGGKNRYAGNALASEEIHGVEGIQCPQHAGLAADSHHAENGDADEPDPGDGPEDGSDPRRSPPLQGEQRQDDHESDGHHQVLEGRGGHAESLHGAQYRDGRSDDPISVEQCRPEESGGNQQPPSGGDLPAGPN